MHSRNTNQHIIRLFSVFMTLPSDKSNILHKSTTNFNQKHIRQKVENLTVVTVEKYMLNCFRFLMILSN